MKTNQYIDESYVSFEVAVRLKELGYNKRTYTYYQNNDESEVLYTGEPLEYNQLEFIRSRIFGTKIPVDFIAAPSIFAAQEWIKKFNCIIEVYYVKETKMYSWRIWLDNNDISNFMQYDSVPIALNTALKVASESIILHPKKYKNKYNY